MLTPPCWRAVHLAMFCSLTVEIRKTQLHLQLWHYEGGAPSRRSLCLFWRESRQRVWTRNFGRDRIARGSWTKELRKGSWRRETQSSSWAAEVTSRHEIESSISEGRPVKMSQHSSWFVEFSLEIHASVSLRGMQCHNLTFLHLS